MKLTSTIAMFSGASLIPSCGASAPRTGEGDRETVQPQIPPVPVMTLCEVNGVDYPIDFGFRIWDIDGRGQWAVIGRVLATTQGGCCSPSRDVTPAQCWAA